MLRPKKNANTKTQKVAKINPMTTSRIYMKNIRDISLLTREEEQTLAADIRSGNKDLHDEAVSKMVKANLRLVVKLAHEFLGRGLSKHDLISEGNIGLMTAAEKFDPEKGAKFSTYATWWIKQAMRKALAEQSRTIRIPVQSVEKISKIRYAQMKLTDELGRNPTNDEIAAHLEISPRTVAELRYASLKISSLNEPIQEGNEGEIQDTIASGDENNPDLIMEDLDSFDELKELVHKLSQRERLVIQMRYGIDGFKEKILEEIGAELGCTRERIRQIQNTALMKLKAMHSRKR